MIFKLAGCSWKYARDSAAADAELVEYRDTY
jgi:hypothetical protein